MLSILVLFGIFSLGFSALSDHATNIQLPFNSLEKQCYYFDVQQYSSQIDIEVEDDNEHGMLNIELRNSDGELLLVEQNTFSQHIQWPVAKDKYLDQIGFYQVCIENVLKEETQIQLIVDVNDKSNRHRIPKQLIQKIYKEKRWDALETLMSLEMFDEITMNMLGSLEESQATLSKYNFRLHTHISEVYYTSLRVGFCASIISAAVLLSSFLQVVLIRGMFKEQSTYGTSLRFGRSSNHYY